MILKRQAIGLLLLTALALFAQVGWYQGKAVVAQWLMADAYAALRETGDAQRPWPWADTAVTGRLRPADGPPLFVLTGHQGEAMAFGPSRLNPENDRAIVIGGHRDTHMTFLADARVGDVVELTLENKPMRRYRLATLQVADSESETLLIEPDAEMLVMITCYPVRTLSTGGTQRLIAVALPLKSTPKEREQKWQHGKSPQTAAG